MHKWYSVGRGWECFLSWHEHIMGFSGKLISGEVDLLELQQGLGGL
jgi:hypothetical protein